MDDKDIGGTKMVMYMIYGICFFIITLLIQFIINKINNQRNGNKIKIWMGYHVVICLCVLGLVTNNLHYLASVIGFVIADEIGKKQGWQ